MKGLIFDQAQRPDHRPPFRLAGSSTSDLSQKLVEAIKMALQNDNFESILSPNREFTVCVMITFLKEWYTYALSFLRMFVHQDGSLSERVLSVGDGVEREAIYLAFEQYRKSPNKWFIPRTEAYSTIATSQSFLLHQSILSSAQLEAISVLGALTGLMLVYGMAPTPLSPALLHYLLHDCNFHSLTPNFIQEWFPSLYRTLTDWNNIDASMDIETFDSHFQLFHDFSVCIYFSLYCHICTDSRISRYRAFKIAQKIFTKPSQLKCSIEQPSVLPFPRTQRWRPLSRASNWSAAMVSN